ncbi:hypothetical protein COLO4_04363 [Corchorus olitorius]|uniref:Uncharacterized protein n=1 Tax=Corchorus olitorius TaxID=93759 RepID=A0A1R3KUE9_9ROSI|nr:hypothetical protein COLO4_04363 [Corchorus olitorius]
MMVEHQDWFKELGHKWKVSQVYLCRNLIGDIDPQGQIWAAPYRWGTIVLAYKKTKFQKLNLPPIQLFSGGVKQAVAELDKILAFNDLLISLSKHPDADLFARGVGPVSLVGGEYDSDRKMDDLKLLYRAYVTDSLSGGRMESHKVIELFHSIFLLDTLTVGLTRLEFQ